MNMQIIIKRLTNVTSSAGAFGYLYDPMVFTRHPERIVLPNTSYITNIYDANARLTATYLNRNDNTNLDYYIYIYNPANQRTNLTRADASTVAYKYDNIGQLKIAHSSVPTEDRGYFYDAAWNLNRRTNNGLTGTFAVDTRNELTNAPTGALNYDGNGNPLASDSARKLYVYDDENRLIQWTHLASAAGPVAGDKLTQFAYDGLGRLRQRLEYTYANNQGQRPSGGSPDTPSDPNWVQDSETHYIYDGWRVIQERDTNNIPTVSYTRGNDLRVSLEGAGGIGGLLARSSGYSSGNWTTHNYYFADGNGNVTYMLNSSQTMVASYRYDPFGSTISSSGTLASANVYRFSSKEIHANSGMYYFGYRFYDPNLQRWLNRDPIEELGFQLLRNEPWLSETPDHNPYLFVVNEPISGFDAFGLACNCGNPKCHPPPKPNGCSFSPNKPPVTPKADFKPCCDQHDICYQTCGSDKKKCDRDFYRCMNAACDAAYPADTARRALCKSQASIYYAAVDKEGDSPFKKDQDKACKCECQK
jgi:RHS repeat-associated protein